MSAWSDVRQKRLAEVPGFAIVRVPHTLDIDTIKRLIVDSLESLSSDPPSGRIAVIEPGPIRVR
jgi:hypothetical protein